MLTCARLCPQWGRGRQGRPARCRSPELPGGELRPPVAWDGGGRAQGGANGSPAQFPPPLTALSLQEAAEGLKSVVPVKFTISSRTDAGVHALSNAAHLDVQRRSGLAPFSPEVVTQALNTHLRHPDIR